MKKTIFISSTFQDLQSHRDQLWKVLLNFDVNITGMEAFGARKSTPLETCLKEIGESDIYIGVISMCYGSIDELTGKSYTQLEYEKAKEYGLEILIYLIDESIGEVKVGQIDFGDKNLRLNSFKRILKSNHTVDFFVNEIDLGQKVFRRLDKLITKPGQLITRPESLGAKVEFIDLGKSKWAVFIGYLNGKPFEIFSALANDAEGVLLPRSVHSGLINKETGQGYTRFDFQYQNKQGYKTTIEGINYSFNRQINIFDKIVSNLLQSNVHLDVVIETIKQMEVEKEEYKFWNNRVIDILKS
jgi:hypothetical protein